MGNVANVISLLQVREEFYGFWLAHHSPFATGISPHADKYCVCDPGPVTPDCKAPQLDHWCMGQWLDVDPGLNTENDTGKHAFAND